MVHSGGMTDREGRTAAAASTAAVVPRAARPPRPRKLKRLGVRHPLKHIRFLAAAKMVADAKVREIGEATLVAALAAPDETETADEGPAHVCGGWKSEDGSLKCGYSSLKGRRASMEDFYDIKSSKIDDNQINFFGVFDGHGGTHAAEYLKEHLFVNLLKHPAFITDIKSAISEAYKQTDSDFLDAESNSLREYGSTASTAILVGNCLYVANVGDSRAVISKAGKGTWRVGGILAMSRAFGNRFLKQFVVAEPEIQEQKIDGELEFLILASDGLWDVVSNEVSMAYSKFDALICFAFLLLFVR
ncbi:hypothetical protein PR202_gb03362 [Eleusine coracana subsp. coracana]|uniref:protein-serine/threonine phosphatase n=1 Tax=Eleusine coracana subsp. coracana TaxID=191504 RepID=A0AAV5DZ90_ELECO|nr:hypothetical protein PR202_gb03362 [Eleusine coracana subsp. coracana]